MSVVTVCWWPGDQTMEAPLHFHCHKTIELIISPAYLLADSTERDQTLLLHHQITKIINRN